MLATIGVTFAAVLVLLDCLGAKSAWSHLRLALTLAGTAAAINLGFIVWSIRHSLPRRGFVLQCLLIDVPSLSGFATIATFWDDASLNQSAADAFVSGCTAINLLVSGMAQVILPMFEAYETAKRRLVSADTPPDAPTDPRRTVGPDTAEARTPVPPNHTRLSINRKSARSTRSSA